MLLKNCMFIVNMTEDAHTVVFNKFVPLFPKKYSLLIQFIFNLYEYMIVVHMIEDAHTDAHHSALMFCNIFNKLTKIYTGTSVIISKEIQPHNLHFYLQSI